MTFYTPLEWDTNFFGFPVAQIIPPVLDRQTLASVLEELRELGFRLAYWQTPLKDQESRLAGEAEAGYLADHRLTYSMDLQGLEQGDMELNFMVETCRGEADQELERLALLSGVHSRFNLDPHISQAQFEELYLLRLRRALIEEDETVLALRFSGKVVGMVALGERDGRGDISLLAVDVPFRRRGFGKVLVRASQAWLATRGHDTGQVVTQERNLPARRLYEICGFSLECLDALFHFWL